MTYNIVALRYFTLHSIFYVAIGKATNKQWQTLISFLNMLIIIIIIIITNFYHV